MGVVNFGEVYEAKQRGRPQLKKPLLEASVCNAGLSRWMSIVPWCKLVLKEAGDSATSRRLPKVS